MAERTDNGERLFAQLRTHLQEADDGGLRAFLAELHAADVADCLEQVAPEERSRVLFLLPPRTCADAREVTADGETRRRKRTDSGRDEDLRHGQHAGSSRHRGQSADRSQDVALRNREPERAVEERARRTVIVDREGELSAERSALSEDGQHAYRDARLLYREGWILILGLVVFGSVGLGFLWGAVPRGWSGVVRIAALIGVVLVLGGLVAPWITRTLNRR